MICVARAHWKIIILKRSIAKKNKMSKRYYKLILFGVFPDGRNVTVIIDNIIPYIYIKIPITNTKKNLLVK